MADDLVDLITSAATERLASLKPLYPIRSLIIYQRCPQVLQEARHEHSPVPFRRNLGLGVDGSSQGILQKPRLQKSPKA